MFVATARSRQLLSDSGAFADWATTSSSAAIRTAGPDDLSLGFNAGPTSAAAAAAATTGGSPPSWSNPNHRGGAINYGLPSEVGMVGLRDVFVVAPAASYNHHQHHHHHHHDGSSGINLGAPDPINTSNAATALGVGVGVGVIPLLTAGPCLAPQNMDDQDLMNNGRGNKISGIQFWQQNQPSHHHNHNHNHHALQYNFSKKTASILDNTNNNININTNNNSPAGFLHSGNESGGAGGNNSSSSGGTTTCQDCGNQAKKDCPHRRCRTCCKSRGYDCTTHVKSTWVPAARRRERQLMVAAVGVGGGGAGSSGSTSGAKKPRLINSQTTSHTSTSNTTPPGSFDTSSSHQEVGFKEALPGQVRAPAVFKCVRVTAVEDGEDEFAYQAVVKINGHVFKGFLYDQGVEGRDGFPNISELHLGGGSSSVGGNGGKNGGSSSAPIMDPSDVYGASGGGGLLGSTNYANIIGNERV